MKLKFKKYQYQTNAVNAVVDCFKGQPKSDGVGYRHDVGENINKLDILNEYGFKNNDSAKINTKEIFKPLSPLTNIKVI